MSLNIPSLLISNNECLYYILMYHQQRQALASLLLDLHSFSCSQVIWTGFKPSGLVICHFLVWVQW